MRKRSLVQRVFRLEELEGRITPTIYGQQWLNSQNLTFSFVQDRTPIGNTSSNLMSFLGKNPAQGQTEILRAFQSWAVSAGINIGLVTDQDKNIALGAPGLIQGDARFGDIRVAGSNALTPDVVATGAPFNWSLGTSSGDVVFNTNQSIAINPTGTSSAYDLFSVALHEAGHVFGFADQTDDPTSVMYTNYQGAVSGLSADDVTNLHALYGATALDDYQGNGTLAQAVPVALSTNTIVNGYLTSIGQVEYFAVAVPANQNLFVTVHTAGYSLLAPTLSVFDANANLLKSDVPNQIWTNDATVNFPKGPTAKTYYIQVASAATNVFGMGGFQLEVGTANPPNLQQPNINQDKTTNSTLATAKVLSYSSVATNNYSYYATMKDTTGSHFYQLVAPPAAGSATEAMLVSVMSLQNSNSAPSIHVYDQQGNPQAFQVLTNDGLNYMVQLTSVTPGAVYFVQISPQSSSGGSNPGDFHLYVNFALQGTAATPAVAGNTLSQGNQTDSGSLVIAQAALVHFALGATAPGSTVPVNVTMTITDSTGKTLFTLTVAAGQPPETANYYLGAGSYTVSYKVSLGAGAPSNSTIPAVQFELDAGIFSDPQGPLFTGTPAGSTSGTSGSSGSTTTTGGQITYSGTKPTSGVVPYYY